MIKIKYEELIKLPYNVLSLLLEIKEAEEKNESRLFDYKIHKDLIEEDYEILKDLIEAFNNEF